MLSTRAGWLHAGSHNLNMAWRLNQFCIEQPSVQAYNSPLLWRQDSEDMPHMPDVQKKPVSGSYCMVPFLQNVQLRGAAHMQACKL